jgi:HNH endonuclease
VPATDSLTDAQKQEILQRDGRRCFIDGHPFSEGEEVEFDHIVPRAAGGTTTIENMAAVCRTHNRQKRTMALEEYRDYLELRRFFEDGGQKYLDDVIRERGGPVGDKLTHEVIDSSVRLYFDPGPSDFTLYECPITGWHYFYALIPIRHLRNDTELQPRSLRDKSMWDLYRHFRRNTQLAPSICRFDGDEDLLLFDGQHKAAAQVWAGRSAVECKVYIDPDKAKLRETNLEAHTQFRQMSFYTAELMTKYASIFGEDWDKFLGLDGMKSEATFVDYLVREKGVSVAAARKEVAHAIHSRIIDNSANKLRQFISDKTRTRSEPLTYNRIQKTLFSQLLSPIPSTAEFQSEDDHREQEQGNLVRLMSIISEEGLIGRWDPDADDAAHKRTERIFSAGAIRAWSKILRDVLNAYLQLYLEGPEEAQRVLYRDVTDEQFEVIRKFVRRIFAHSVWDAPDTADQDISKRLTKDDDITAMQLLRERGLNVDWVLRGAGEAEQVPVTA